VLAVVVAVLAVSVVVCVVLVVVCVVLVVVAVALVVQLCSLRNYVLLRRYEIGNVIERGPGINGYAAVVHRDLDETAVANLTAESGRPMLFYNAWVPVSASAFWSSWRGRRHRHGRRCWRCRSRFCSCDASALLRDS
jgi:hypothetical protein